MFSCVFKYYVIKQTLILYVKVYLLLWVFVSGHDE